MSAVRIFVPRDATACALGADRVAAAIVEGAAGRGIEIELLRNGSRGAFWLEPLVEVETAAGRLAFGPIGVDAVPSLFDAGYVGHTILDNQHCIIGQEKTDLVA